MRVTDIIAFTLASLISSQLCWAIGEKGCGQALENADAIRDISEAVARIVTDTVYVPQKLNSYELQRPVINPILQDRFNSIASPELELISPYLALQSNWTEYDQVELKTNLLLGRAIVGWKSDWEPDSTGNIPILFFSGTITNIKITGPKGQQWITFQIRAADGSSANIKSLYAFGAAYLGGLYLVETRLTPEERVKTGFRAANFERSIAEIFGEPSIPRDFEVAEATVETYLSLPATFGATSVIKTLRGQKSERTKNHKFYGFVKGESRYSDKALRKFLVRVISYMEESGLLTERSYVLDTGIGQEPPEWLKQLKRTPESWQFLKVWEELASEKIESRNTQ